MNKEQNEKTPEELFNLGCDESKKENKAKAFKLWKQAADKGHVNAQFIVGFCYSNGYGVEKDPVKTFAYYKQAADNGDADAQVKVGTCYKNRDGTKQHFTNAFKYFKLAATNGDLNASIAVKATQLLSPEKEKYNQNISKIADEIIGLFKKIREILTPEVFNKNLGSRYFKRIISDDF